MRLSVKACLPTTIRDVGRVIDNDAWVMELKMDGQRTILKDGQTFNRHGDLNMVAVPKLDMLAGTILDGEVVGGSFYVFDIMSFGELSTVRLPWTKRRTMLEQLADFMPLNLSTVVDSNRGEFVKLYRTQGGEGVVFKRRASLYESGRSRSWLKYKYQSTLDAVILGFDYRGLAQSMELGLYDDDGRMVPVGGCKVTLEERENLVVGDVVEVRYRPVANAQRLIEPVLLRKRVDKLSDECTITQLSGPT